MSKKMKEIIIILSFFLNLDLLVGLNSEPSISVGSPNFSNNGNLLNVEVSWHNINVYGCEDSNCGTPEVFETNAIQYKEVNKLVKPIQTYLRSVSDEDSEKLLYPSKGTINFSIIVRSDISAYQLAYVSGSRQYPEINAISEPIVIPKAILYQPREVRLSLVSEEENSMRIMWTESSLVDESFSSKLLIGESSGKYPLDVEDKFKYAFRKDLLCEGNLYPAQTVGFSPLGTQVETIVKNLVPGKTYYYTIQYKFDTDTRRIAESSFINSNYVLPQGTRKPTNIIGFGDMGQSMNFVDGSLQHSFDNSNHGELASSYTAKLLKKLLTEQSFDSINHFGDISYATGQLALWNSFFYSNSKVFASVPWMTGIGNHELGWSHSYVSGGDSQGECGVPYMFFFPFSTNVQTKSISSKPWSISAAIEQPYYSFKLKSVFNIMISTETDFSPGSHQFNWLENELKLALRLKLSSKSGIQWILLMGHRPMYISDKYPEKTSKQLLSQLEDMLVQYRVDIALWGHHHSYQRFKCKVYQEACYQDGVVQILTGHAGFNHSPISKPKYSELFAYQDNTNWGVSTFSFKNSTHCEVKYLENKEGKVLDRFWVKKSSSWLS